MTITTNTGLSQNVSFGVSINSFLERDQNGLVSAMNVSNVTFTTMYYSPTNSTNNTMWIFSAVLQNQAVINISVSDSPSILPILLYSSLTTLYFFEFNDPSTDYLFYNETKRFPANTLKTNVRVAFWPFKSIFNTLDVVFTSVVSEGGSIFVFYSLILLFSVFSSSLIHCRRKWMLIFEFASQQFEVDETNTK